MRELRLGTRGSPLALAQAREVATALEKLPSSPATRLVVITTEGDRRRRASLLSIGGQGVFTRALEVALLDNEIDIAVHSLKDLPSTLPEGLRLAGALRRADPRDLLVTAGGIPLAELAEQATVGTASLRRRAQLLRARPHLTMKDIRGNVETRLARLAAGEYDAIVLAAAGLQRLWPGAWEQVALAEGVRGPLRPLPATVARHLAAEFLPVTTVLPAPSQAIIGLECRASDERTLDIVAGISDPASMAEAMAERAVLHRFGIGCRLPLAAYAVAEADRLHLRARILSQDGARLLEVTERGDSADAVRLGERAAERLVEQGALSLLDETLRALDDQ